MITCTGIGAALGWAWSGPGGALALGTVGLGIGTVLAICPGIIGEIVGGILSA